MRSLFLFAFPLAIVAACGGDDSSTDAGPGPDTSTKEAGGCPHACDPCIPPKTLTCFPGAKGKVCLNGTAGAVPAVCPGDKDGGTGTMWTCDGTIPPSVPVPDCGCFSATFPTLNLHAGDDCPPPQDSGIADTSTE